MDFINEAPRSTRASGTIKNPQPKRDRETRLKISPALPALSIKLRTLRTARIMAVTPITLFLVSWEISKAGALSLDNLAFSASRRTDFSFFLNFRIPCSEISNCLEVFPQIMAIEKYQSLSKTSPIVV